MKTLFFLLIMFLLSCGPNQEEIRLREKALRDSFALAEASKKSAETSVETASSPQSESVSYQAPIQNSNQKSTSDLRGELKTEESANPLNYLYINNGTWKVNLINELVVEGWVCNKATLAGFKDINLKIISYSKTGRELSTKWVHVDEFIQHGKCVSYKRKVGGDKSITNVTVEVHSATPY
jgi:hypothetical protein